MMLSIKGEKRGRPIDLNHTAKFKDMLDYYLLADLGYSGHIFTWVKTCRNGNFVQQRLDRVVVNPDWILKFPNAKIMHLTRLRSDHCPSCNPLIMKARLELLPFRYEPM